MLLRKGLLVYHRAHAGVQISLLQVRLESYPGTATEDIRSAVLERPFRPAALDMSDPALRWALLNSKEEMGEPVA